MSLNNEEMAVIMTCAHDAVQQVLANSIGDTRAKYMQLVYEFAVRRRAPMLMTSTGLAEAVTLCFGDENSQVFTERLQFAFFSYWGSVERIGELCDVLSWSAGISDVITGGRHSVVPKQIRDRTANRQEVKQVLEDNSWLIPYLLLPMVIHVDLDNDGKVKSVRQKE